MTLSQTINQFLKHPSHLPKNIIWRFPKSKSTKRHIFVLGAPRSGTTLVKLILGAHQNLSGPGYETAFFMYKDIFSFSFGGVSNVTMEKLREKAHDIVEFFDLFSEEALKQYGGTRFIEKTPPHVLRLDFLVKYFPSSNFINIFRDGRDAYCSARRHVNVIQGSNIKRYAKYWKKCIESRLKLGEHPNIIDVKYEELSTNPEKIVKEIMDFLKEDFDIRQLEPSYFSKN